MALRIGSKSDDVKRLQRGLNAILGISLDPDGSFGPATADAVEDFQDSADLYSDGVAGPDTIRVFNGKAPADCEITTVARVSAPAVTATTHDRKLVSVSADRHPRIPSNNGGFGSLLLRDDAAAAFKQGKLAVNSLGGVVTTAGGIRPLSSGGGKDQSATSLHYVGLAHDLSLPSGMQRLDDPYLIEPTQPLATTIADPRHTDARRWRVWCRTENTAVPERTVTAVTASQSSGVLTLRETRVTSRLIDITEAMRIQGFVPIRARAKAFNGLKQIEPGVFRGPGRYTAMEWWHFQWTQSLVTGQSRFGTELLRIYDDAKVVANFAGWANARDAVWGVDWA